MDQLICFLIAKISGGYSKLIDVIAHFISPEVSVEPKETAGPC